MAVESKSIMLSITCHHFGGGREPLEEVEVKRAQNSSPDRFRQSFFRPQSSHGPQQQCLVLCDHVSMPLFASPGLLLLQLRLFRNITCLDGETEGGGGEGVNALARQNDCKEVRRDGGGRSCTGCLTDYEGSTATASA